MNNFIVPIASGSAFLLSLLILSNPNKVNKKANLWFGFFVLCIFFILIEETLSIISLEIKNEYLLQIVNFSCFIIAPTFYLSVSFFINPLRILTKKDILHFSFGIIYLILLIITFYISSDAEKNLNQNNSPVLNAISTLFIFLFCLQLIAYCFFSYRKLITHQKNVTLFSSNANEIDLKWLKNIIISILILSIIWTIDILFNISDTGLSVVNLVLFLGIYFISYNALKQKEIYPYSITDKNNIIELIKEDTYSRVEKKKLISDEFLEKNKIELLQLMQTKKLYLDSELSIVKIAAEMNTTPHLLSYIINSGFEENFYQFVNRFRIEEAKRLILDPKMDYLSILGIGFEVGFNSKTVFNTTFKKTTNQTPSEFKKQNKITIN